MNLAQPSASPLLGANAGPAALPPSYSGVGLVDVGFGIGHAALVTAAVASIFIGNQYLIVAIGIGEAALIASHVWYRKWGINGRNIAILDAAGKRLDGTVRREGDVEAGLAGVAGRVGATVEELRQENTRLQGLIAQEQQNNQTLTTQLQRFTADDLSLDKTTRDLEAGTSRIAGLIPQMRTGAAVLAEEDGKVDESASHLQKVVTAIGRALGLFPAIEAQFKQNQDAVEAEQRRNQELAAQMALLQKQTADTDSDMQKNLRALQAANQQLTADNAALKTELTASKANVEALGRARAALSTDEHQLADSMNAFQTGAEARRASLAAQDAALLKALQDKTQ